MSVSEFQRDLFTPESKSIMTNFLTWAKTDRDQAVSLSSKDLNMFRDSRIVQSTYTRDETISMLDSLAATVRGNVSDAHSKLVESVGELVRSVLAEADAQRVALTSIDAIKSLNATRNLSAEDLARQKMMGGPSGAPGGGLAPLAPMGGAGGGCDTQKQLQQANDLIKTLRTKLHAVEDQYRKVMDEKSRLTGANMYLGDQLSADEKQLQKERENAQSASAAANAQSQKSVAQLSAEMDAMKENNRKDMQALQKKVNELLKEQQGKLSESSQFQSMKKMLREKTDQVKKLRDLLRPHNPQAAGAGDDDIATDDDDD